MANAKSRQRKGGKGGKRKIGRSARKAANRTDTTRVHRDSVYHRGLGCWLAVGKGIPVVPDIPTRYEERVAARAASQVVR